MAESCTARHRLLMLEGRRQHQHVKKVQSACHMRPGSGEPSLLNGWHHHEWGIKKQKEDALPASLQLMVLQPEHK